MELAFVSSNNVSIEKRMAFHKPSILGTAAGAYHRLESWKTESFSS